jgi:hypothetical protein
MPKEAKEAMEEEMLARGNASSDIYDKRANQKPL